MIKIIAPKIQHDIISKMLLKEKNILTEVQILPLQAFIGQLIESEDNLYDRKFRLALEHLSNEGQLKTLSAYIDNDNFIKSIKDFHIDMYLYNIKIDDLSDLSSKDQDLKIIFKAIKDLVPNEISNLKKLKQVVNSQLLTDVYISEQSINNNYFKEVINILKSHGAQTFEQVKYSTKSVELYYANNKRSEIEASAQLIVNNNLDNAQVIVLDKEYLPLIEQVYNRYNIDFGLLTATSNNTFYINFIKSIKLIEDNSEESLKEFLSSNPFDLDNISSLTKLNDLFQFNLERLLDYKFIPIDDEILHQSNLDYYQEISQKALIPIEQLKLILSEIIDFEDKPALLEFFFNLFLDKKQSPELRRLRQILVSNKEIFDSINKVWPVLEKLLLNNAQEQVNVNNVIVCSPNNHYYFNKDNVIILGASANNYPIIDKHTGVIDEKYLENLCYPKKAMRFSQQLLDQKTILNGNNIFIFYPLSSFDGKAVEPSFSLVNFAKEFNSKARRYPLIENDALEYKVYKLDKNLSKQLFFKDGKLNGSISAFEQYNNCNYSYFLKSGLKLYPKELPDLSYGYIGSIIHAVMEEVTNREINQEQKLSEIELKDLVNRLAIPLEALNPTDEKIRIVKHLLIRQLSDVLMHIYNIDADTNFKPIRAEAEFFYTVNDNINLKGYVDRSDQYFDALRVIDFKSSNQSLSENSFKQGLQLQLITYLLVMSKQYNLKPAGAFYQTMRINNTNVNAARVLKSKEMYYPLLESDIDKEFLKNNRINGWHFMEAEDFYQTEDYVGGLSLKKTGLGVRGKPKNFETVIKILEDIYQQIYDDLSEGKIDCKPVNNPCEYCSYHSICLSNTKINKKPLIYEDQKLDEEIKHDLD